MNLAFHLVSKKYFDSLDPKLDYRPEAFNRNGFIHCTDNPAEMARVANRFYKTETPSHLYLYIDKERVLAPIRYEDEGQKYPHIYGGLNRDAIVKIVVAERDEDGNFLAPGEGQGRGNYER